MFAHRQSPPVVVLRDAHEILDALREALAAADEHERPGLERALSVARSRAEQEPPQVRGRWARRRLAEVGFEGPLDSVQAVRALRQAEPSLDLRSAVALTREAAAVTE